MIPESGAGSGGPIDEPSSESVPERIRETIVASDRPQLEALLVATGFFRPGEVAVALEVFDEGLARGEASGYHFLVLERGNRLLGYTCYGQVPLTQSSWDLYWIAVHPQEQGRGLGRGLVREAELRAASRGAQQLFIETSGRPLYEPTRQFYLRCGYRVAARLADFYAPGDDKWIFARDLRHLFTAAP